MISECRPRRAEDSLELIWDLGTPSIQETSYACWTIPLTDRWGIRKSPELLAVQYRLNELGRDLMPNEDEEVCVD